MINELTPDRDSSLGLIFRLNSLWSQVDYASVGGDYPKWNNLLDALHRNLLFRESMVTDIDEKTGKVTKVKLSNKDMEEYRFLSLEITKAIRNYKQSRFRRDKGLNNRGHPG